MDSIKLTSWQSFLLVLGLLIFLCTPLLGFKFLEVKGTLAIILILLVPVICLSVLAVVAVYKIAKIKEKQIEFEIKKERYTALKSEYEFKNKLYSGLNEKPEQQSNQEEK